MRPRIFIILALAAIAVIVLWNMDLYFLRTKTEMEKNHPGCVAGVASPDYQANRLPTGFMNFYIAWGDDFPKGAALALQRRAVLVLTWEPYDAKAPEKSLLSDISGGAYDRYIAKMAADIRSYGGAVIVRWGHEPNGDWYSWSGSANGRSPAAYVAAYRRVAGILRASAGSRARLMFSVNGEDKPCRSWNRFEGYYPGDEYVDVVGIDVYNWGNTHKWSRWRSFSSILRSPYERYVRLAPLKPLLLSEVGSCGIGGDKNKWLVQFFERLQKRFPAVKGFIWFDYQKECDWRISADPALVATYNNSILGPYFSADGERSAWMFNGGK